MVNFDNNTPVRSRREVIEGLLNDPKNHNRRDELELLIEWRLAYEGYKSEPYVARHRAFKIKQHQEEASRHKTVTGIFSIAANQDNGSSLIARGFIEPEQVKSGRRLKRDILEIIKTQPETTWIKLTGHPPLLEPPLVISGPEDLGIRKKPKNITEQMNWGVGWHEDLYRYYTALPKPTFKN